MNVKLDKGAYMPIRAHISDAGMDLRTPIDVVIPARGSAIIDTGVHIELPPFTTGFLKSKSGLNVNHGVTSEGVIDVGYTGSIRAKLYNHSHEPYQFKRGDKITQLVILPIMIPEMVLVSDLQETERGDNGFGSSGK